MKHFNFLICSISMSLIVLLSGCNNTTTFSDTTETTTITTDTTTLSTDEETKEYLKDDDGYYILEDDYFKHENDPLDVQDTSTIFIPDDASDYEHYNQIKLYVSGVEVPIYNVKTNISHTWTPDALSRMNNAIATIGLSGKATFIIQANFNLFNECTIRPLSQDVKYKIDFNRRTITFEITNTGEYTIELRSGRTLHLFVEDIPTSTEYDTSAKYYFAPGVHNSSNDSRIPSNGKIRLYSNEHVYLAPGAIVEATFEAYNQNNITISGLGYISGANFKRDASTGDATIPLVFSSCTNITFKDFSVIDPAGWCFNMYFSSYITIDNCKIISSRSNGDGISLQSCSHVNVTNCFVRTWDDSLVVKNYIKNGNPNIEGKTEDIHFSDCIIWTDLAQSMEIGYETVGVVMDDITFKNITVLHNYHKAVISIHNANNANITNVVFDSITIEDASLSNGDGNNRLIDIQNIYSSTWSDQYKITSLGSISNVTISNVKVKEGIENPLVLIKGCIDTREKYQGSIHKIDQVTITNLEIYGKVIDESYVGLDLSYTDNFTITKTDDEITGAIIKTKDTSSYGSNTNIIKWIDILQND